MICPRCLALVPEDKLACPDCTERRYMQLLIAEQPARLAVALEHRAHLRLVRTSLLRSARHVLLLGHEDVAFCGVKNLESFQRERASYRQMQTEGACRQCLAVIEAMLGGQR